MQINSGEIEYIVGSEEILNSIASVPAMKMFSEQAVGFLAALSRELLNDKAAKGFVDVVSYAYWIRMASLKSTEQNHPDRNNRIGRGVALHIAPSNVPVNFAVSMTSSLLAGNCTVIRVSNKRFEQVDIICKAINKLLDSEFSFMKPYICIVRYAHNDELTAQLSSMCDVRIVWGGNRTIEEIRKAPLPPRAIEMTFADRHSIAIINSDEYMNANASDIAKGFYTDTYYSDQNACSSPRLVVWTGSRVPKAKERFWAALEELVHKDYDMKPIQAVNKFTSLCMLGMTGEEVKLIKSDNYVMRAEVSRLTAKLMNYKDSSGYFFEYTAQELDEIVPVLTKQCQTVAVLGVSKQSILDLVIKHGVRGVDRIVPLGQTMGLEFIWDGYKMIEAMTRFIYTGDYGI